MKQGDVVVNVSLDLCQIIQFDCGAAGIEKQVRYFSTLILTRRPNHLCGPLICIGVNAASQSSTTRTSASPNV